jgi:hypothetical protein
MSGSMDGYVTQTQFNGTLALLQEIRVDIKGDVADLRDVVLETKREITVRQDVANGRTAHNEVAVTAAHTQIAEVAEQVREVQTTVTSIKQGGCDRERQHLEVLNALGQAGVVPETGELLGTGDGPRWTRKKTAGAIVGAGVGGSIVTALAPHIGPALHWLAHFLSGTPLP